MKLKSLALILLIGVSAHSQAARLWASIPFIRGADLCAYKQAYSQTRSEYMREMTGLASQLMQSGAKGDEALDLLVTFDALYDKNVRLATQYKYMDVTLENTLKAYFDSYYRNFPVVNRKLEFVHMNNIRYIMDSINNGQRPGWIPNNAGALVDYMAYGSYSYAPNCRGGIQVTLTLVSSDGSTKTYQGQGQPSVVMSQIASTMFEDFQRTKFPATVQIGRRNLTIVGTHNGSVGRATSMRQAERACDNIYARLPNANELEAIDAYGDWNGGVSIGQTVWAISGGKVYHPGLMNPTPVRNPWSVNTKVYSYYCVR
ncbi:MULTISPECIES: hypothetical protein [Halobacteriovorax]|uniref:Uncharacterized protein n=1 Tax=Halobacteriovorax vibrionivorans TaxID=2152716 RepID=A0ABY0IH43_9BACT|nr:MULTISPECIES: hypothetical protein [Halobacteriovorax]RZF22271.1 hypothetical protein DAY19_00460 [Halobacteriovorax vibrionivorans]TGD48523.1 hypothetical protein EP118_03375 [Halobacteriovorax sp. Y22]